MLKLDTRVYIDSEGRPWARFMRNGWERNKGGSDLERITNEQAGFLFSLGYTKTHKDYAQK
jgi:hypothetical protein